MPHLSIRIDFDDEGRLGPGKVTLLERIAREGSISAAGRSMNMSYKRAWELVSEINRTFEAPLVMAQTGGRSGGGATLTERGREALGEDFFLPAAAEEEAHHGGAHSAEALVLEDEPGPLGDGFEREGHDGVDAAAFPGVCQTSRRL